MDEEHKQRLLRAARHWEGLAVSAEDMAKHEATVFGPKHSVEVFYRQAETYRRCAKSLRLEVETGKPHCTNCLGSHPEHECKKGSVNA